MNILDNVIDTKEAAEKWGLSQARVKDMCQKGEIIAKKIGNSWAVDATQENPKKYNADAKIKTFYVANEVEENVYRWAFEEHEVKEDKTNRLYVERFNYEKGRHDVIYLSDYKIITSEFVRDLDDEERYEYQNELLPVGDLVKLYKIDDKKHIIIKTCNEWHVIDSAQIIDTIE